MQTWVLIALAVLWVLAPLVSIYLVWKYFTEFSTLQLEWNRVQMDTNKKHLEFMKDSSAVLKDLDDRCTNCTSDILDLNEDLSELATDFEEETLKYEREVAGKFNSIESDVSQIVTFTKKLEDRLKALNSYISEIDENLEKHLEVADAPRPLVKVEVAKKKKAKVAKA